MAKTLAHCPTHAEIDLDALAFNLNQVRSLVGKKKKILAVVKANAYGHGSISIARELENLGVDFLGVAFIEEGIQLRKAGIQKPILILGGIFPFQVKKIFTFRLTPVVFDLALAHALNIEGKRQNQVLPVHIKIDTGMNRLGVPFDQTKKFFSGLQANNFLKVEGFLSHFSSANLRDKESKNYTADQIKKFKKSLSVIKKLNFDPPLIHMDNSSAIIENLTPDFTMVRAGLMLYGAYPSDGLKNAIILRPVMSLKSRVIQTKFISPGSPISYNRTFYTKKESLIATLAIGYGDGYHYRLSNRGGVLIQGKRLPIVGSVCMDLMMADVTEAPGIKPEDEVVLFGRQGKAT
ncbi:MAG TPA: alanine racemase, partial [Thermodesulfobacteriota bacterium]|nr:alanine racemase [Thermodesulfobacteriota bacterium]